MIILHQSQYSKMGSGLLANACKMILLLIMLSCCSGLKCQSSDASSNGISTIKDTKFRYD